MAEKISEKEILRIADTYRPALDLNPSFGSSGVKAGQELGSSVEIQDFRNYVPGDDPRRIDWFSYARTNELIVRLYREEVSPFFDIIVDTSASMDIEDGRKGALTYELASWLFHASLMAGIGARLFAAGAEMTRLEDPKELNLQEKDTILFRAPSRAAIPLRRSSMRCLISDFMSPEGVIASIASMAASCSRLLVIHLLGPWEADPNPKGPAMLFAKEAGHRADLTLDHKAVTRYKRRLLSLKEEVRLQTLKWGGHHMEIKANLGLESLLRKQWLPQGLVEIV